MMRSTTLDDTQRWTQVFPNVDELLCGSVYLRLRRVLFDLLPHFFWMDGLTLVDPTAGNDAMS